MALSVDRLQLLHRVADQGEAQCRRALAQARQQLEQQLQTQSDLQGYLDDYQRMATTHISAALLENRHLFVQRLRSAVTAQTQQIEFASNQLKQAEQRWIESRSGLRIAEQMRDSGLREAWQIEDRAAQRRQDDETLQRRAVRGAQA